MDASKFDLSAWENGGRVVRTFRMGVADVLRTNGCAALYERDATPPDGCEVAGEDTTCTIATWLDDHGATRTTTLRDRIVTAIPKSLSCDECDSTGIVECECCDGEGALHCSNVGCERNHGCDACSGAGVTNCNGCGRTSSMQVLVIDEIPFNTVHLAPLSSMGAVSLCIHGAPGKEVLVFNDGDTMLAVMRMTRASDSEIIVRVSWPDAKVIP